MPMVKRRTVSFDEFVQNGINLLRGYAMIKGFDIDFTTVINLLAEYGLRKMYETAQESEIEDPLLQQVFTKYLDYDELKKWGIIDEWKDLKEYMEFKEGKESQETEQFQKKPIPRKLKSENKMIV